MDLNHRPQGYEPCELTGLLYPAERPARIELASSAWQADGLPLHHGRFVVSVFQFSVGSEGLEPSPPWVRTTYAAANTLIP